MRKILTIGAITLILWWGLYSLFTELTSIGSF